MGEINNNEDRSYANTLWYKIIDGFLLYNKGLCNAIILAGVPMMLSALVLGYNLGIFLYFEINLDFLDRISYANFLAGILMTVAVYLVYTLPAFRCFKQKVILKKNNKIIKLACEKGFSKFSVTDVNIKLWGLVFCWMIVLTASLFLQGYTFLISCFTGFIGSLFLLGFSRLLFRITKESDSVEIKKLNLIIKDLKNSLNKDKKKKKRKKEIVKKDSVLDNKYKDGFAELGEECNKCIDFKYKQKNINKVLLLCLIPIIIFVSAVAAGVGSGIAKKEYIIVDEEYAIVNMMKDGAISLKCQVKDGVLTLDTSDMKYINIMDQTMIIEHYNKVVVDRN